MRGWLSAYGGAGEEASERAINKLGKRCRGSVNAYPSYVLTYHSSRECIILKGCGQLTQRTSARTLAFLCSNPTPSGNDLEEPKPLRPSPVDNSPPRNSREFVANLYSRVPGVNGSLAKRGPCDTSTSILLVVGVLKYSADVLVGSPTLGEAKLPGVGGVGGRGTRILTIFFALRLAERKLRNVMLLGLEREARQKWEFGGKSGRPRKAETEMWGSKIR